MRKVARIEARDAYDMLLNVHYAGRIPSISACYGLFREGLLEGVVSFGTPPSAPLRSGIAGPEWAACVWELNRLCLLNNNRNDASYLVSGAIRMIEAPKIIVSFADTSVGHVGTVYQACNFIYCGLSAKRTDWKVKGREHLHGQTIADEFRGSPNRSALMREKYGDDFYLQPRPRKHRYVYLVGSRAQKKEMRSALKYPQAPYPKASDQASSASI